MSARLLWKGFIGIIIARASLLPFVSVNHLHIWIAQTAPRMIKYWTLEQELSEVICWSVCVGRGIWNAHHGVRFSCQTHTRCSERFWICAAVDRLSITVRLTQWQHSPIMPLKFCHPDPPQRAHQQLIEPVTVPDPSQSFLNKLHRYRGEEGGRHWWILPSLLLTM